MNAPYPLIFNLLLYLQLMLGKSRPILAVLLGLLTLLSASRFSIGTHLCSGKVRTLSFLGTAERCAGESDVPPCHRSMAKSCCEDQLVVHNGDELATPESVADYSWTVAETVPAAFTPAPNFFRYDAPHPSVHPPPPSRIYLRIQRLLI